MKINATKSEALNAKIGQINERFKRPDRPDEYIPSIGWYWRAVDFTEVISLGDCGVFVGFMENNKWNYPEWDVTEDQDTSIKSMLLAINLDGDEKTIEIQLEAFYQFLQTCTGERTRKDIRDESMAAVDAMGPTAESMMGIQTKVPID